MKMVLEKGDTLTHKASGQVMVVLKIEERYKGMVTCSYYNELRGTYERGDFWLCEFVNENCEPFGQGLLSLEKREKEEEEVKKNEV